MARNVSLYGILIATIVVLSLLVVIPVPATNGFVTLCDGGIYAVSLVFGPLAGFIVGGLSGGLIDLFSGYPQWMVFSFFIHGLQGWLVGHAKGKANPRQILALLLGCLVMMIGYFFATSLLYGYAAGWASIFGNSIQSGFGLFIGLPMSQLLQRALQSSHLRQKQSHHE
ncbi:ECF transporter S component [Enterococcus camelliae]|uniref:ECF transporter S component n=1 Tax=Enterococcus camelliae TaxID=453959 RepID=A0ABW5TIC2_9ENTE